MLVLSTVTRAVGTFSSSHSSSTITTVVSYTPSYEFVAVVWSTDCRLLSSENPPLCLAPIRWSCSGETSVWPSGKVSTYRAEDLGIESRLSLSSRTSDLKMGTKWQHCQTPDITESTLGLGCPGVSIRCLDEIASLYFKIDLCVAACTIV